MGCYNPAVSTTPVLDQLAREGVKFENAFTVQPVCGPARSCLQTGRYPTQNGCYRNNIAMRQDEVTLAKLFNQAGYDTAYIGKWHLADLDEKTGAGRTARRMAILAGGRCAGTYIASLWRSLF